MTAGTGSPGISRHLVIWRWIVWLDSGLRVTRHDSGHWVIRHWIVWLDSGHQVTRYDSGHGSSGTGSSGSTAGIESTGLIGSSAGSVHQAGHQAGYRH
ncbi:unnamed protein product, partial [Staurois parvus]